MRPCSYWRERVGVDPRRIARMGEKDNFWSMGETGPCGPCSEIIFDQGEGSGLRPPGLRIGCDCDRFIEMWNLVFMQYEAGELAGAHSLPQAAIDTGMGLERIAAVVQGSPAIMKRICFSPSSRHVERIAGPAEGNDKASNRVIADHSRPRLSDRRRGSALQ